MAVSIQPNIAQGGEKIMHAVSFFKLTTAQIWLILVIGVVALKTANPFFTLLSIAFVPFALCLLWREGEPPALFFGVLFQWLSITAKVWYADFLNKKFIDIQTFPAVPETIEKSFLLSLAGLVFFTLAIHIILRKINFVRVDNPYVLAYQYDPKKVIFAYVGFYPLSVIMLGIGYAIPGMQQVAIMLLQFKWALFFLLLFTISIQKQYLSTLYFIMFGEVVLGFTGYFSSFKDIFIMAAMGFLTFGIRLKPLQYGLGLLGGLIVFNLSIVWTYIKPEYRSFLTGGAVSQSVIVSRGDALGKVQDIYKNMTEQDYDEALIETVNRISYIEYFSACINYVPVYLPHQGGEIWGQSIEHVLFPRILFPNKPILDDSEQTAKYTGQYVSGKDTATSISLGYMAESYVDFGVPWMFFAIFLLALVIGSIYRFLLTRSYNALWGYALVIPVFYITHINGMSSAKVLGGALMYFLVTLLINRFVVPRLDLLLRYKR